MAVSICSVTCVGAAAIKMPYEQSHGLPFSQSAIEAMVLLTDKWSTQTAGDMLLTCRLFHISE
jgi:hypothetical protein